MTRPVAIVVGGAEGVLEEFAAAENLCVRARVPYVIFYTNVMITEANVHGVAVTLHPELVKKWIAIRNQRGYPRPHQLWCLKNTDPFGVVVNEITDVTEDWGGSVSLYGFKVAREKGHDKVIFAGAPMEPRRKHFLTHQPWPVWRVFWTAWEHRKEEIKPFARSLSGRTKEMLGEPTEEWLRNE